MKTIEKLKNKWLRNIGYGLSLTTIAFIFQACYGPRQDLRGDVYISGKIVNAEGSPIQNIKISNDSTIQYSRTDENGEFYMYLPKLTTYTLIVEDDRGEKQYIKKDTTLLVDQISDVIIIMQNSSEND